MIEMRLSDALDPTVYMSGWKLESLLKILLEIHCTHPYLLFECMVAL
jgi:hypothetical protein